MSQPELGAANSIHPSAPMKDGVMNAASTSTRIRPRPGMSVRDTNHAMGTPRAVAITAVLPASTSELSMGSIRLGVVNMRR